MYIQDLTARHFRNYTELRLSFSPEINFIIGSNGVGKTNILEAISVASNIKSFRNIHDAEIMQWGEDSYFCAITALSGDDSSFEVGCARTDNSVKKKLKIDGKVITNAAEYYGRLLTVILSPNDLVIINGTPDLRRRFFDSVISKIDAKYFKTLIDFKKILASRNRILKESRSGMRDLCQLDAWDNLFSEKAGVLIARRRSFIDQFTNIFRAHYADIGGGDKVPCIRYQPGVELEDAEGIYRNLVKLRSKDHMLGMTSIGPQRDEYILENEDGVKFVHYASQGQRRTAAVALKIAECLLIEEEKGKKAVVLVDDIFSELDDGRRARVIDILRRGNQIIFTMVHYDQKSLSRFGHYKGMMVSGNGEVSELS